MKNIKLLVPLVLLLAATFYYSSAQKLLVHDTEEKLDTTYTVEVGDVIVIAHQKPGKKIHYFQGKVTGIFEKRGVVRVFDYARSSRVFAIVGKKIKVDEIVGIKKLDNKDYTKRETGAVAMAIASSVGAAIGGRAGTGVQWGAAAGRIGNDVISREALSKQHITVEFKN